MCCTYREQVMVTACFAIPHRGTGHHADYSTTGASGHALHSKTIMVQYSMGIPATIKAEMCFYSQTLQSLRQKIYNVINMLINSADKTLSCDWWYKWSKCHFDVNHQCISWARTLSLCLLTLISSVSSISYICADFWLMAPNRCFWIYSVQSFYRLYALRTG